MPSDLVTLSGALTVAKTDADAQLVFGWANVSMSDGAEVWDSDDETVPPESLEKAAYEFVIKSRETGTDHDGGPARGTLVESLVTTAEKQERMGLPEGALPVGWWVGFHVNDDAAWKSVKDGDRLMFSIEGTARREVVEDDETRTTKAVQGSSEARTEALRDALSGMESGYVWVRATFDDSVVYETSNDGDTQCWSRPYTLGADGVPMFGQPTAVEVAEVVVPEGAPV